MRLPLLLAALLGGCTAAAPLPAPGAAHPASVVATTAPHPVRPDTLPPAEAMDAPSGLPASRTHESTSHTHAAPHRAEHGAAERGTPNYEREHRLPPVSLPPTERAALDEAVAAYLAVADRLADDTVADVPAYARTLEAALARLTENHRLREYAADLAEARTHAEHLGRAGTLTEARAAFGQLGPPFARLVAAAGPPRDMTLTRFVCGMADAPERGVWLQAEGEPRNPYFGASMLRCHRSRDAL